MQFRCSKCGVIITNNLEKCSDMKYLQCINPECGYVAKNPNYKGEKSNGS
jgi:hypothetical protein